MDLAASDVYKSQVFFFFKQKTAYEIGVRLVGSEMCIRDRVCTEYAYGDYEMIEACIIAAGYEEGMDRYYREVVQRHYTQGSHPVRNKQWNNLKLLKYTCVDGEIVYEDVTPPLR